ncbi:DUF427 domain-containing protein [Aureimonas mangrovi]|uniref:DUF427 domain-containing protein n=1 Tax=Aureimonas mangrovi TaxID=2758041 RepID=UPI00163DDC4A|nr:DUF427 domain-containing protein [Aureimonas mangrovi]
MSEIGRELRIEPASGGVTIKHHDAVLGSSNRALVVRGEREAPVHYLPKEDVYFEQLQDNGTGTIPNGHAARFWSVVASGGGVQSAAWQLTETNGRTNELSEYIGFDPAQLSVMT